MHRLTTGCKDIGLLMHLPKANGGDAPKAHHFPAPVSFAALCAASGQPPAAYRRLTRWARRCSAGLLHPCSQSAERVELAVAAAELAMAKKVN
jgi:hypothetical protein